MRFEVTILGNSSATPVYDRNPTAQLLNHNEKFFLIDCGEGTQHRLLRYGIKYQRIDYIFISHLHGDHYYGLIGLLSSMSLNGRVKPIFIYAPAALESILAIQIEAGGTPFKYPIEFFAIPQNVSSVIFENESIVVETIVLQHRVPCTGFLFKEKSKSRKVLKDKVTSLAIPTAYISLLKRGIDYRDASGQVYAACDLTSEPDAPRVYAYCSDTVCSESYLSQIEGVDLLYHEATFMHDMVERASLTFHTTAQQAGEIARKAKVKKLLIGHFSARYKDLTPLHLEAKCVFENTELAQEGMTFSI